MIVYGKQGMNNAKMLAEAWRIQTTPMTGEVHVIESHAFACHADGSDCDGGSTCTGNARRLNMLSVALLVGADENATFEDFAAYWTKYQGIM